eukprot:m.217135 g.217135  ORF g.217135 m.217135 type:complete len:757 (-) comp22233_c0_seq3:42-2312(-)
MLRQPWVLLAAVGLLPCAAAVEWFDTSSWQLWLVFGGSVCAAALLGSILTCCVLGRPRGRSMRESKYNSKTASAPGEPGAEGHGQEMLHLNGHAAPSPPARYAWHGTEGAGNGISKAVSFSAGESGPVRHGPVLNLNGFAAVGESEADAGAGAESPLYALDNSTLQTRDISQWQVEQSRIHVVAELDEGFFGPVFLAQHRSAASEGTARFASRVVVKTLRQGCTDQDNRDFVWQIKALTKLQHPNVLRLLGINMKSSTWRMIVEYCPYGDMLSASRVCKQFHAELQPSEQLWFAQQLASALHFVTSKGLSHKNLSLRYALLSHNNTVKLAHFRSARSFADPHIFSHFQQNNQLPFKTLAPEVLRHGEQHFTQASDVWSFGLVLWELATHGKKPFRDFPNAALADKLENGHRPDQPVGCSAEFYEVMADCWALSPQDRPNFELLWRMLSDLYNASREGSTVPARDVGLFVVSKNATAASADTQDDLYESVGGAMQERGGYAAPQDAYMQSSSGVYDQPQAVRRNVWQTERENVEPYATVDFSRPPARLAVSSANGPKQSVTLQQEQTPPAVDALYSRPVRRDLRQQRAYSGAYETPVDDEDHITPVRASAPVTVGNVRSSTDESQPWLHFNPSKKVSYSRLQAMGMQDGVFLIRGSRSKPGDYMLLLCCNGSIHNFRIKQEGTQYTFDHVEYFDSLTDLVAQYSGAAAGQRLPTRLQIPCPRPDSEMSYNPTIHAPSRAVDQPPLPPRRGEFPLTPM